MEWEKDGSIFQNQISVEDLAPLDKMKLSHATNLIALSKELETSSNVPLRALGIYFKNCNYIYSAFHDNNRSIIT